MFRILLIVGLAFLTAACAPNSCDSSAAVAPGRAVSDNVSNTLPAHVDITEVSTTLAGETLTAVFHLRDVPETLTFDRTGVEDNDLEYRWEVRIDVDGIRETGPFGFDYSLSASHYARLSDSGSNLVASMTAFGKVQTNVWKLSPMSGAAVSDASLEVSTQENTLTLSGEIPGITADSRLAFQTYDYLAGSDEVACQASSTPSGESSGPAAPRTGSRET